MSAGLPDYLPPDVELDAPEPEPAPTEAALSEYGSITYESAEMAAVARNDAEIFASGLVYVDEADFAATSADALADMGPESVLTTARATSPGTWCLRDCQYSAEREPEAEAGA